MLFVMHISYQGVVLYIQYIHNKEITSNYRGGKSHDMCSCDADVDNTSVWKGNSLSFPLNKGGGDSETLPFQETTPTLFCRALFSTCLQRPPLSLAPFLSMLSRLKVCMHSSPISFLSSLQTVSHLCRTGTITHFRLSKLTVTDSCLRRDDRKSLNDFNFV